jgi:hypothetical protein
LTNLERFLTDRFSYWIKQRRERNNSINLEMAEINAYLDLMYHTLYKPRAERMLEVHAGR